MTGVALATPVGVLAMSDGAREIVGKLDDRETLVYSYRQSIYEVPVYEEFVRGDGHLDLLRVRSPDIRSVEYFRWDGAIVRDAEGLWTESAPPSEHTELVIRVTGDGAQRVATPRWSVDLLAAFGESVVTARLQDRPLALVLLGGTR